MGLKQEYFAWLCDKVGIDSPPIEETYWILAKKLHDKQFYWTHPMDVNRARDGEYLRYEFLKDTGVDTIDQPFESGPCTVLEMLVALALKWESSYMRDIRFGDRTRNWFMEMMRNLGLAGYSDDQWSPEASDDVDMAIQNLLDRAYNCDGTGGSLFPLLRPRRDSRTSEIWLQLSDYINETQLY